MVKNIRSFEYIITDSETEALILECNLIKRYKPKYNVLLRDDKTYPYIKVTTNEDFPRVIKVRKVAKDKAKYFGPYTNITAVNDTLEVIRDTYPIRTCKIDIDRAIKNKMRPCLNYHIKKCMGPCTGKVSKEEYRQMIDEVIMCLSGKEEKLVEILTEKMQKCAADFRFEILECNLIKRYKPKYNVLLRDDKTYPYIKVTTNEDFPRVIKVRKVAKDKAKYFGPYTNITAVNDTLEVIRDTYPIRTCKIDIDRAIKNKMRPCLNYHIKKCMGPCTGKVSKEEYRQMIDEVIMCLSGKEEKLVEILTEKMQKCAADFRFEEAAVYRDKIKSLEEMVQKQKIDTNTLDLNQDIIAMARANNEACVQIFFVRNGKIVGREHFILEGVMDSSRESILGSFAKQFYMEQEYIPKEIIIEDEIEDQGILEDILTAKKGQKVVIRVPQKGEKKSLVEMVRKNALEYLEKFSDMNKRKYEKSIGALEELKNLLELEELPIRIESFDISNIQGVDSIGSMVVYTNGKKDKKEYRRYKIKTVIGPNDYDSMAEILERRIKHGNLPDSMVVYTNGKKDKKEYRRYKIKTVIGPNDYDSMAEILERRIKHGNLPDLILLDGGKGQVGAVRKVFDRYGIDIPLWGMYKDDKHRTKGLINETREIELSDGGKGQVGAVRKVFDRYGIDIPLWGMYKDDKHRTKGLINETREIELSKTSNLYRFVAGIQEEVHNYAITYHRSLRDKKLTKSELDNIPGVGEKRKKALLAKFKTLEGIKNATLEELEDTETMNSTVAQKL